VSFSATLVLVDLGSVANLTIVWRYYHVYTLAEVVKGVWVYVWVQPVALVAANNIVLKLFWW